MADVGEWKVDISHVLGLLAPIRHGKRAKAEEIRPGKVRGSVGNVPCTRPFR